MLKEARLQSCGGDTIDGFDIDNTSIDTIYYGEIFNKAEDSEVVFKKI